MLAYHIVSCPSIQQRWEYFVDAVTGNILHQYETTCFVDGPKTASAVDLNGISQTVNTYQVGSNYFMVDASRPMFNAAGSVLPDEPVGSIFTIDMNNTFGENTAVQHFTSRVAFTSLNGTQQNIDYVVLNSDKISANGSPVGFIADAKWPVYFATGERQTGDCVAPPTPTISTNGNTTSPTLTSSVPSGNQWFLNGTSIPGATGNTLNVTETGTYTVQATVSGCPSAFSADFQVVVTGISEQTKKQMSMNCYPTFFANEVSVELDQRIMSESKVELINTRGQKVYTYTTPPSSEDTMLLNLENVQAGYYVLRISNAKKMGVCRIVKN